MEELGELNILLAVADQQINIITRMVHLYLHSLLVSCSFIVSSITRDYLHRIMQSFQNCHADCILGKMLLKM